MGETADIRAHLTVPAATDDKLHALASDLQRAFPANTMIDPPADGTPREQWLDILAVSARDLFIESTHPDDVTVTDHSHTVNLDLSVDYLALLTQRWLWVLANYAVGSFEINSDFQCWKYELVDGGVYTADAIIHYGPLIALPNSSAANWTDALRPGAHITVQSPQGGASRTATIASTFDTRYEQFAAHVGDWFTVLGPAHPDANEALEDGSAYMIRFADGTDIVAFPEEITDERWPNHPETQGQLRNRPRPLPPPRRL